MAGAGPAGLALALQAHDHGAVVRVVDRRPEAVRPSRALILHARTLEVLRPLGVDEALLARADIAPAADLRLGCPTWSASRLGESRAAGHRLSAPVAGASDGRGAGARPSAGGPRGRSGAWHRAGRGCRGARRIHAVLRAPTGTSRPGSVSPSAATARPATVRAHAAWAGPAASTRWRSCWPTPSSTGTCPAMPPRRGRAGRAAVRLPPRRAGDLAAPGDPTRRTAAPGVRAVRRSGVAVDLQALFDRAGLARRSPSCVVGAGRGAAPGGPAISARPMFLAGDAAHAYSPPATGQDMGTWPSRTPPTWAGSSRSRRPGTGAPVTTALLDSYNRERRPVARQMLALTNLVFWAEAGGGPVAVRAARRLAPLAAPLWPRWRRGRRGSVAQGMRLLAQFWRGYRDSPLSVEGTPRPARRPSRRRLPDRLVPQTGGASRLHELLAQPGVRSLLHRDAAPLEACRRARSCRPPADERLPGAGLVAVVRPDGYVGFRSRTAEAGQLRRLARPRQRRRGPSRSRHSGQAADQRVGGHGDEQDREGGG